MRRTLLLASAATVFGVLNALPAAAQPQRLTDRQLSEVRGQVSLDVARWLAGELPAGAVRSRPIDRAAFDSAMAMRRLPASVLQALPPGQFTQVTVAMPSDFRVDASQWLRGLGLQYNGPSFGTFEVHGLDMSQFSLFVLHRP